MRVEFEAKLWIWDARPGENWTFVSLPVEESDLIRDATEGVRRGFGSLRVRATVGGSTWTTSIFPGGGEGAYILPIKRQIRTAESIEAGDPAAVTVELLDV
ncbi:DUF1905 domain-containing protein [Actinoplanes sp. NPDC023936]|uniref:DUF1905 domain-containing protein n=1 Tax=Actinoplanes sp. NPDC023936 TaxID=3154910 RepID=UPI0033F58898